MVLDMFLLKQTHKNIGISNIVFCSVNDPCIPLNFITKTQDSVVWAGLFFFVPRNIVDYRLRGCNPKMMDFSTLPYSGTVRCINWGGLTSFYRVRASVVRRQPHVAPAKGHLTEYTTSIHYGVVLIDIGFLGV